MKRTAIIGLVLLAGTTVAVSAQGFHRQGPMGTVSDSEEASLAGTIQLQEGELPVLVAENVRYTLMIDPSLAREITVENNASVTVTGWTWKARSRDLVTEHNIMRVRTIEIGGTRYVASTQMRDHHPGFSEESRQFHRGADIAPRGMDTRRHGMDTRRHGSGRR